jgi:hypothetical protein
MLTSPYDLNTNLQLDDFRQVQNRYERNVDKSFHKYVITKDLQNEHFRIMTCTLDQASNDWKCDLRNETLDPKFPVYNLFLRTQLF